MSKKENLLRALEDKRAEIKKPLVKKGFDKLEPVIGISVDGVLLDESRKRLLISYEKLIQVVEHALG
jgi:hypothetical protein